ncbi:MAG: DUF433 domain-containing protein [Gammaproteobacteria bacterium]|nr:DUF433 domain-containing protein [Gammaproteobacteria bacterium]MYL14304.1 DUF433 domain-containing protein [Gammaproteobacteria bacterium]
MTRYQLTRKDPRALPAYTITEVAHYLTVPPATIRYWSVGRDDYAPLIEVPRHSPTLLSFLNLTELHVLAAIRRRPLVKMPSIRRAINFLVRNARRAMDKNHPLISRDLETDGLDLFIQEYGQLINISRSGQIAMREIISGALTRIHRDPTGIPIKLFPFTRSAIMGTPTKVIIDPTISAGRPVIAGTGLTAELIAERYKAGESISALAQDYERTEDDIEEAIRCESQIVA